MSYWILPVSEKPISCVTMQRLSNAENSTDEYKEHMQNFTIKVNKQLETEYCNINYPLESLLWNTRLATDIDDPIFTQQFQEVVDDRDIPEADDIPNAPDEYISMELGLPHGPGCSLEYAKVNKCHAVDHLDRRPLGVSSNNPLTDT